MKTTSILLTAILVTASSGCIVVQRSSAPPPVVVVDGRPSDNMTCAEIDAASKLNFDSSRAAALKAIAGRENLSPAGQVHLINRVLQRISFDSTRVEILETLIKNPAFCNAAKQNLLAQIHRLSFDQHRATLLRLIHERGELTV